MEELLPDILGGCKHRNSSVREGHLTLFQFLPVTLEAQFQPYLQRVLPAILDGLADEAEGVRDAALGAGTRLADSNTLLTSSFKAGGTVQTVWGALVCV